MITEEFIIDPAGPLTVHSPASRTVLQATGALVAAGLAVKCAAIGKEIVVAAAYGRSDTMDAFLVAFLIPSLLINILAESMNQALIPVMVRVHLYEGAAAARRLFSNAISAAGLMLTAAAVGMALAARLMLQDDISGLPVVDRVKQLVGIVTEGDFMRRTETGTEVHRPQWLELLAGPGKLAAEYARTHARRVDEVMSTDVVAVTEDAPLDEVISLMEHPPIKRKPVIHDRALVGIISRANLLRALPVRISEMPAPSADDRSIRDHLLAEFRKQRWNTGAGIDVTVHDGVVELWGAIMDERERQAFRVAAENVPGVLAVKDHLCWVEPMSGVVMEAPEAPATGQRL